MTDQNDTLDQPVVKQTDSVNQDDKKTSDAIPYARFKEVNDSYNELKAEVAKMRDAQEKARKADLERKQEFESLYNEQKSELERYQEKATAWDSYQADRRDVLLSKLPEEDRELYEELSLTKLEKVVEKNVKHPFVPDTDSSSAPRGGVQGYSSPKEVIEAYRKGEITNAQAQAINAEFRKRTIF